MPIFLFASDKHLRNFDHPETKRAAVSSEMTYERSNDMTAEPKPAGDGGPKTEGGKEVTRWNATRHGISSPEPVVPGLEKREDWEEHRRGILENLSPVGLL